jgi:uncharacterized protein (UPF0332 family)
MHAAGNYLGSVYGQGTNTAVVAAHPLSLLEANNLRTALLQDAKDYYFSACITLAHALMALESSMYTWATVQLYYCVFYALRARLAIDGRCIFNAGRVHFCVFAKAGELAAKTKENTHKSVLRSFESLYPSDILLSQQIELQSPLDWLMSKREAANYGSARFVEPSAPDHFNEVETNGLRLSLNSYLADESYRYVFDPDHAMLAFPLKVIEDTGIRIGKLRSPVLEEFEEQFIRARCRDNVGSFNHVLTVLQP